MTQETINTITMVIEIIAVGVGGALAILWTARSGFFSLHSRTIESYKEALDSSDQANEELKERVSNLEAKVDCLEKELGEMRKENEVLRQLVNTKEQAIAEMMAAVATSGACARSDCPDRILPTGLAHA